jgi:hypothetical protein
MPNFAGQPLGSVSLILQDAGYKLGNVTMAPAAANTLPNPTPSISIIPAQPSPASIIVTQTPPAGQKVLAGATVNFEVR